MVHCMDSPLITLSSFVFRKGENHYLELIGLIDYLTSSNYRKF